MESLVRSALLDLVKAQLIKALVSWMPFFAGGIPGMIAKYFIGMLAEFLIDKTILGAKILHSNHQVNRQVKNLEDAIEQSKRENLNDAEKERILKKIRDASDSLINF